MVGDEGEGLAVGGAGFDFHDAAEDGRVKGGAEGGGIHFSVEDVHIGVVGAFETVDQRAAADGDFVRVAFDFGMRAAELDGHVEGEFEEVGRRPGAGEAEKNAAQLSAAHACPGGRRQGNGILRYRLAV